MPIPGPALNSIARAHTVAPIPVVLAAPIPDSEEPVDTCISLLSPTVYPVT